MTLWMLRLKDWVRHLLISSDSLKGRIGSESFTKHTVYSNAYGPRAVDVADIDGDGYMDILSASYWDKKIAWYENMIQ